MYSRSSLFVLAIGFSILIVLIAVLGFGAIRRADDIYRDMQWAQDFNGKASVRGGLGLLGIRERVEALEGSLFISSRPNAGTTIQVQIPVGVPA
jgi:hypothetical protein